MATVHVVRSSFAYLSTEGKEFYSSAESTPIAYFHCKKGTLQSQQLHEIISFTSKEYLLSRKYQNSFSNRYLRKLIILENANKFNSYIKV